MFLAWSSSVHMAFPPPSMSALILFCVLGLGLHCVGLGLANYGPIPETSICLNHQNEPLPSFTRPSYCVPIAADLVHMYHRLPLFLSGTREYQPKENCFSDWWNYLSHCLSSSTVPVTNAQNCVHLPTRFIPTNALQPGDKSMIKGGPGNRKLSLLYFAALLLMQAGDCETNPGPNSSKFPCSVCHDPCTWEQRAIQCDECDGWYHAACMGINTINYEILGGSNISWMCCNCGMPNFSTSLFSQWSLEVTNSFSSLNESFDDAHINPPVATSSPKTCPKSTGKKPCARTLTAIVVNFNSVKNKVPDLAACLQTHKPDIVIGTETWLNPHIANNEIFPEDYTLIRKDRSDCYGGVLIAIKKDIIYTELTDADSDCEIVWAQIQLVGGKTLYVGAFYRPPNQTDPVYLSCLKESLCKLNVTASDTVWLGGDFNLPNIDWPSNSTIQGSPNRNLGEQLIDIAEDLGLHQTVTEPTRQDNILDLFFTNRPSLIEKSTLIPGLSDHDGIPKLTIDLSPKFCRLKPYRVYLYKKADTENMRKDLATFCQDFTAQNTPHSGSVEQLWSKFKIKLQEVMDTHIPSKMVTSKNKLPWLNQRVKRSLRHKQKAYNKARASRKPEDWETFREHRRTTHKTTRQAHRNHVRKICMDSKKKFWSFVNRLRKDSTGIPSLRDQGNLISDNAQKAELLNMQFQSVFTKENMDTLPVMRPSGIPTIPEILVSAKGVEKLLQNINPSKATGPDNIPPRVLKEYATELAPVLAIIFQVSLDTGLLPADWKVANVSPIHKKGSRQKPSNYRPISLTSVTSKLLEHIVQSHIMGHFETHDILTPQQHGFRAKHSCETQLIQTMHDLTFSLNNSEQTDIIIMDFSKAFDTVPHNRLLLKLKQYGVDGSVNRWISCFLKNRKQRVVIGGEMSKWASVDSGVPQGTVLGPLLFNTYINDLPDHLHSTVRLFADDCVLYRNIRSTHDSDLLQSDLNSIASWTSTWQMKFNVEKCYVLRIPASRSPVVTNYSLDNTVLKDTASHTYLGVDIQQDLKWNNHVSRITLAANKTLGFARRNLNACTKEIKSEVYKTLIRPSLEYCSAVWDPHTKELTQKLDKVQRRAARMVHNNYNWDHSASALVKNLEWTDLATRREINRLNIFHKAIGGHLAIPVHSYLQPAQRRTRRSNANSYIEHRTRRDCYKFSFIPRTTRDWNNLPPEITSIASPDSFQATVRSYLTLRQQED